MERGGEAMSRPGCLLADSSCENSATFVNARNVFLANNRNAQIGTNAFGFSWGAWFLLIFATVLLHLRMKGDRTKTSTTRWRRGRRSATKSPSSSEGGKRRVKEEYA